MLPAEYAMLYPESMKDKWIQGAVAQNMDKDFVRRIMSQNQNASSNIQNKDGSRSNLRMANADNVSFPTLENRGGALQPLGRGVRPQEAVEFNDPNKAAIFSREYKRANREGFGYY